MPNKRNRSDDLKQKAVSYKTSLHDQKGSPLGGYVHPGKEYPNRIPEGLRSRSIHMIGEPGSGKSNTIVHMALYDIEMGNGVVVIDPHGDLIEGILRSLREEHIEKKI